MILLLAYPFYLLGTTAWNFFIILAVFFVLLLFTKKYVLKRKLSTLYKIGIVIILFLFVNLIPLPLPGHQFSPTFGEYTEPASMAVGWPGVFANYYMGEGDLCSSCVDKDPIHTGMIKTTFERGIRNLIALIILIPISLFYLKKTYVTFSIGKPQWRIKN